MKWDQNPKIVKRLSTGTYFSEIHIFETLMDYLKSSNISTIKCTLVESDALCCLQIEIQKREKKIIMDPTSKLPSPTVFRVIGKFSQVWYRWGGSLHISHTEGKNNKSAYLLHRLLGRLKWKYKKA